MGVGVSGAHGSVRRAGAALLAAAVAAGGLAGCSGDDADPGSKEVSLTVAPAGKQGLAPESPITVRASKGTIENVTVATKGDAVAGELNSDRTVWRSRWTLQPDTAYTVTATGLGGNGKTATVGSSFRTAKVSKTVETTYEAPKDGETVGVGMPIVVNFDGKVTNRAAVERALEVRSSKPVQGAWHWFEDEYTGGSSVVFRTKEYWPSKTKVSFRAHLSGVPVTKGVYGAGNKALDFEIGDRHIITASENDHTMVVRSNGKVVRRMDISMGKGGVRKYTTTNGIHLTMDKADPVVMTSSWEGIGPGSPGYYSLTVYDAVRISDSGEYVHSAPWSVGSQGNSNVSHGCVNAAPADAEWFYDFVYPGDPVEVTGSPRELEVTNGWGYWQMNWTDWVKGSALKQSLRVGPNGTVPAPNA